MKFRQVLNIAGSWLDYHRRAVAPRSLPYMADIEPTTRCNFACPMCQTATWRRPRKDMPLESFRKVLDGIPTLTGIKLQGMGEPLLNPAFFEMVRMARERGIRVKATTNGSLLDPDRRRELLACGIHHVDVSLDGAVAATHEALRPGARFEQIVENLSALMVERGKGRLPRVRVWFVAQKRNLAELPALVDLCATMGVDALGVQWSVTNFGSDVVEERVREQRICEEAEARGIVAEARRRAERIGLTIPPPPWERPPAPPKLCRWPWERTYISAEGFVCPCCLVSDPQIVHFGNLLEEDFRAIWRGKKIQGLRKALIAAKPPGYCKACRG